MAMTSIPGNSTAASGQAPTQQAKAAPAETPAPQTPQGHSLPVGQDTVKLSGRALAHSLKQQGHTIDQIAHAMQVDVKTVAGHLGASPQAAVPAGSSTASHEASPAEEAKESALEKAKEATSGKG